MEKKFDIYKKEYVKWCYVSAPGKVIEYESSVEKEPRIINLKKENEN